MKRLSNVLALLVILVISVLLIGFSAVRNLSASNGPEIPFAGGAPIATNVVPVVIVKGSDYDMGYQYAQQLVQIFGKWIFEKDFGSFWAPSERFGRKFTSDDVEALKANQWYIEKEAPEMIGFMKGVAAGATDTGVAVSYMDVLAHFVFPTKYLNPPAGSQDKKLPPEKCSGFAAWGKTTRDGKLICSSSADGVFEFNAVIVFLPETGNNFMWCPYTVTLTNRAGHPGMNNKGLAYVHHGNTYRGLSPEERGYGITRGIAVPHTLRFANNAIEAEKMLLAYHDATGQIGGLWADVNGNAFNIENRKNPKVVRRPGDCEEIDFLYATNNFLGKEMGGKKKDGKDEVYIPHGGWLGDRGGWYGDRDSVTRNLEMWNMFHYYRGNVDLEFVNMMWRYPGKPPNKEGKGWDAQIASQYSAQVLTALPDKGDNGLMYVSAGGAARVAYFGEATPPHIPNALWSFYQLKLASSPAGISKAALERGRYELTYANRELRKLNYSDPAYLPLNKIFNQAATKMFEGEYYENLAGRSIGNESIYNYSKATRAFTTCQALAQHVYNALVPPPTSTQDLGLAPYGFWVGVPKEK